MGIIVFIIISIVLTGWINHQGTEPYTPEPKDAKGRELDRKALIYVEDKFGAMNAAMYLCEKVAIGKFNSDSSIKVSLAEDSMMKSNTGNIYSIQANVTLNGKPSRMHVNATFRRNGPGNWDTLNVTWVDMPF